MDTCMWLDVNTTPWINILTIIVRVDRYSGVGVLCGVISLVMSVCLIQEVTYISGLSGNHCVKGKIYIINLPCKQILYKYLKYVLFISSGIYKLCSFKLVDIDIIWWSVSSHRSCGISPPTFTLNEFVISNTTPPSSGHKMLLDTSRNQFLPLKQQQQRHHHPRTGDYSSHRTSAAATSSSSQDWRL
jgi:hypothetical protein